MKVSANLQILEQASSASKMGGMLFVSLALHVAAISALFFLPNLSSTRTLYTPVFSVRLVSPAPAPAIPEGKAPEMKAAPAAPAPSPVVEKPKTREKEKPVSLAPKKEEAKKEDTEKKIAEAINRIRQRKETQNVESAIERLREEKESRQVEAAIAGIRKRVTISGKGAVESDEPSSGRASTDVMTLKHKIYYNLIWKRIQSVWVLPDAALAGQKKLETIIAIRIARDGQIISMQFEKKSGNPAFDESAQRAIQKANPLPPLPPGIEGDKFDMGVLFTPSDL